MSNAVRHHFHFSAETPHILPLSFVDEFGRELDVSHYEISGMVLQQGQAVSIEAVRPTASTAVVTFPKLVAGSANYRVDITSPAGTEIPMIYGTIHVMGRESAPSGADELDAISVSLPTVSEQDVTIKILGALDLAQFGAEVQQAIEEVKDSLAEQKKYAEAMKDSLAEHANDAEVHATADEKAAWNAKLSPSDADARYGLAGTIPGQVVNGQSFSTNLYLTGNRSFSKSVDFDAADIKNPVLELNVDNKSVRFFDSYIESYGIAFFHTLYTSNLSVEGVLTGTFSGTHRGSFSGGHYGETMLFTGIVEDFEAPGWRLDKTNKCVDFKGVLHLQGKPAVTCPMSIHYDLDNQKVDVANLEVKGETVLRAPESDADVVVQKIRSGDDETKGFDLCYSNYLDGRFCIKAAGASSWSLSFDKQTAYTQNLETWGTLKATSSATFNGAATFNKAVTFVQAPVVPVASGASEAMSLGGWAYQKASADFKLLMNKNQLFAYLTPVREECWKSETKLTNGEVLLRTGWVNNVCFDVILMQKAVAGADFCYINAGASPHTVTTYLGLPDYGHERAVLHYWRMNYNVDDASVSIGGENYMNAAGDAEQVRSHAIHWNHQDRVVDTRYPRLHEVNTATETSWHYNAYNYNLTAYGAKYLGAEKSMLLRATDFYCEDGKVASYRKYAHFKWALLPKSESLSFAVAPINSESASETHYITKNILLVTTGNKTYKVLDMHGGGNGNNTIRSYRLVMKRHKGLASGQYGVGCNFRGFEVYGKKGECSASATLHRVVNEQSQDYLPMPEVTADVAEVPAEGGQVMLTVAPTGHNAAIYCLNDTMDGSGTFEVWCVQDKEEVPAEGGQITLTIAPNTTGADRLLWVFVGHHFAEATKVELVQKGV